MFQSYCFLFLDKSLKKTYFDKGLECAAPKCWSKSTTHHICIIKEIRPGCFSICLLEFVFFDESWDQTLICRNTTAVYDFCVSFFYPSRDPLHLYIKGKFIKRFVDIKTVSSSFVFLLYFRPFTTLFCTGFSSNRFNSFGSTVFPY